MLEKKNEPKNHENRQYLCIDASSSNYTFLEKDRAKSGSITASGNFQGLRGAQQNLTPAKNQPRTQRFFSFKGENKAWGRDPFKKSKILSSAKLYPEKRPEKYPNYGTIKAI